MNKLKVITYSLNTLNADFWTNDTLNMKGYFLLKGKFFPYMELYLIISEYSYF